MRMNITYMSKVKVIFLLLGIIILSSGCVYSNNTTDVGTNGTTTTIQSEAFRSYFLHSQVFSGSPYASYLMIPTLHPESPVQTVEFVSVPNGNISIANWTSVLMNTSLLPASTHTLHIHANKTGGAAHVDKLYYQCGTVTEDGKNLTIRGTSELSLELTSTMSEMNLNLLMGDEHTNFTDRMVVFVYVNQTGSGVNPNVYIEFEDLTDSRLEFRAVTILNYEHGLLKSLS